MAFIELFTSPAIQKYAAIFSRRQHGIFFELPEKRPLVLISQCSGYGFDFIIPAKQAFSLGDFLLDKILPYAYAMRVAEEMRKPATRYMQFL